APMHLRTVLGEAEVQRGYAAVRPLLSLRAFGSLVVALRYAGLLVFLAVAALIVWQRPEHPLSLVTALMLLTLPLMFQLGGYSESWLAYPPAWRPVLEAAYSAVVLLVGLPAMLAFGFLFPSGRPAPRWLGWLGGALTVAFYGLIGVG